MLLVSHCLLQGSHFPWPFIVAWASRTLGSLRVVELLIWQLICPGCGVENQEMDIAQSFDA